jgi:hypothetical protein
MHSVCSIPNNISRNRHVYEFKDFFNYLHTYFIGLLSSCKRVQLKPGQKILTRNMPNCAKNNQTQQTYASSHDKK